MSRPLVTPRSPGQARGSLLLARLLCFFVLILSMPGCAGLKNPFAANDPLTSGVNTGMSRLLDVPVPSHMQRFPGHGFMTAGAGGAEGLEVLLGRTTVAAAAREMHSSLTGAGWQLRFFQRKGERLLLVYEKSGRLAVITVRPQDVRILLEIWAGSRLPDGASLDLGGAPEAETPGEEYAPLGEGRESEDGEPKPGQSESWGAGSGGVEEHSL